jgi:hypothetical protein
MSGGKVGAQVGNVACQLPKAKLKPLEEPCSFVYGASEEYMMWLIRNYGSKEELNIKYTVDAGFTEWTIGILTCLGWKLRTMEDKEVFCSGLHLWKEGMQTSP